MSSIEIFEQAGGDAKGGKLREKDDKFGDAKFDVVHSLLVLVAPVSPIHSTFPSIPRDVFSWNSMLYMTTQKHDSSHPQHSHCSPQPRVLGLMMVEMEEATLGGILLEFKGGGGVF